MTEDELTRHRRLAHEQKERERKFLENRDKPLPNNPPANDAGSVSPDFGGIPPDFSPGGGTSGGGGASGDF
jgi:hypothetical protein